MKSKNKDLVGTQINGLQVTDYYTQGRKQFFGCICVCKKLFRARTDSVKAGTTQSCGCLTGDLISQKNRLPDNLGAIILILRHYKNNAKKRKLKFSLSLEEFKKIIFSSCEYCGSPPQQAIFVSGQENRRDREISYNGIDRIDNSIGYVVSNCVSCCHICNGAKSNHSVVEFQLWIKRLVSFNAQKSIQVSAKEAR